MTETSLDTGRTEHPTVTQKAPHKMFRQVAPVEEEEEETEKAATFPAPTPSTRKGPGIGTGSRHQFKYSAKCRTDLPRSKDDTPPPLKKNTISSITAARKNEESTHAPHK